MYFFPSFVVYFDLRLVASSCTTFLQLMVTWRKVFVYYVQTGFREQGNVIDSYGEVQLASRNTDNSAGPAS